MTACCPTNNENRKGDDRTVRTRAKLRVWVKEISYNLSFLTDRWLLKLTSCKGWLTNWNRMKTAQSVHSIEGLKVAENRRNSTHPCAAHIPITFISVNCLGRASKCFSKNYRLFFFFFWPIPAAFKWVPVPFPHPICSFSVAQAVPHLVPTLSTLCHCFNDKDYPGFFF